MGTFQRFLTWLERKVLARAKIGSFDEIGLADVRGYPSSFQQTIRNALELVRAFDARRYKRIRNHLSWIVNRVSNGRGTGSYGAVNRVCNIEFSDTLGFDADLYAAIYAVLIVHEATHGAINDRGIKMEQHNRIRIERLCTAEQNRFAMKLIKSDPIRYPEDKLYVKFRAGLWHEEWTAGRAQRARSLATRLWGDRHV